MKEKNLTSKSRILKGKREVKGFTPMNEFKAELEKEYSGLKKKESWRVWINQKQWLNDFEKLNPTQRCILINLKFYQRTKKDCYPSEKRIASDLGIDVSTVCRNLPGLIKSRKIKIVRQPGRVHRFKVVDF